MNGIHEVTGSTPVWSITPSITRSAPSAIICLLVLAAAACTPAGTAQNPSASDRSLLFRHARVIVGDGTVITDAAFVVRNGLLLQVGNNQDVVGPPDAIAMDLTGKTVMPAIVNAH